MSPTKHDAALRLPPLELECLQALWALGEGTVQQLHARLHNARPLAYTTVMTVMDRLARKGMVSREKRGRAHLYQPLKSLENFRRSAVDQIVKEFFGGSRDALAGYLQEGKVSPTAPPRAAVARHGTAPTTPVQPTAAEPIPTGGLDPELL
jgi:predicted transcriptional regulator